MDELIAVMIRRVEGECSETRIGVETVSNSGTRVEECRFIGTSYNSGTRSVSRRTQNSQVGEEKRMTYITRMKVRAD